MSTFDPGQTYFKSVYVSFVKPVDVLSGNVTLLGSSTFNAMTLSANSFVLNSGVTLNATSNITLSGVTLSNTLSSASNITYAGTTSYTGLAMSYVSPVINSSTTTYNAATLSGPADVQFSASGQVIPSNFKGTSNIAMTGSTIIATGGVKVDSITVKNTAELSLETTGSCIFSGTMSGSNVTLASSNVTINGTFATTKMVNTSPNVVLVDIPSPVVSPVTLTDGTTLSTIQGRTHVLPLEAGADISVNLPLGTDLTTAAGSETVWHCIIANLTSAKTITLVASVGVSFGTASLTYIPANQVVKCTAFFSASEWKVYLDTNVETSPTYLDVITPNVSVVNVTTSNLTVAESLTLTGSLIVTGNATLYNMTTSNPFTVTSMTTPSFNQSNAYLAVGSGVNSNVTRSGTIDTYYNHKNDLTMEMVDVIGKQIVFASDIVSPTASMTLNMTTMPNIMKSGAGCRVGLHMVNTAEVPISLVNGTNIGAMSWVIPRQSALEFVVSPTSSSSAICSPSTLYAQ